MSEFTLEIGNRINNELSPVYNMWSVDTFFEGFIRDKKISAAIEIGRCNGISTLILARTTTQI